MKTPASRKRKKTRKAFHVATLGRVKVPVYLRRTPTGTDGYLVVNYSNGKRRFDSYADADLAIEAANKLARQMSERQVVAAAMTNDQASEYAAARQTLSPFNVGLLSAADAVADALRIVGGFVDMDAVKQAAAQGKPLPDLANLREAAKFFRQRHKHTTPKPVAEVVTELRALKEKRGLSVRYLGDLKFRLNRIADHFRKNIGDVTTADIQAWLDSQKLAPQSYKNFRAVLNLLFDHAVTRGFASDNPVAATDTVKVKGGTCEIFTPLEITRLLEAATPDFLPALAIGAFAGLRSAEIERLEWSAIDLQARHIVVSAGDSKTASRRIVPMADNLAAWLQPYAKRTGSVWRGTHDEFYEAQQDTAAATEVKADPAKGIAAQKPVGWKANALRHSFASYRFAQIGDAGRVAGECGNSSAVIHKHYRELVKPADATKWFNVKPEQPANVTSLAPAAVATA